MELPQSTEPLRNVSQAERDAFERDGVVCLRAVYPQDWLDYLATQLNDIFYNPGTREVSRRGLDGHSAAGMRSDMVELTRSAASAQPNVKLAIEGADAAKIQGRSVVETDASFWHAGMRAHQLNGPLANIVASLTGSSQINFYSDQLFLKEPGSLVKTPFHQDKPYFLVDGGIVAVCWVPVDEVTRENGAMGYVKGSHRWGKLFKPSDFITENGTFQEANGVDIGGLDTLDPVDPEDPEVIYFDTKPGDIIIHNWSTLHGSAGNSSEGKMRRAASVRYACEGCYFHQRKSSPEPFRYTVDLEEGEPLENSERFPVVWPR